MAEYTVTTEKPYKVFEKRVGVCVLIKRGSEYLLCERQACRDMNGLWQLPGGAVEGRESAWQAAVREVSEETSLNIDPTRLEKDGTYVQVNEDGNIFVTTAFKITLGLEDIREPVNLEPDRHGPWEWLTYEQIMCLPHIPIIHEMFK